MFPTPLQKAIHKISSFPFCLNPIQPSPHFLLNPTLNLSPNPSKFQYLPPHLSSPRFNEDVPSVVPRNKNLGSEMRDQRILMFGIGVQPGVHFVAEMVDVKALAGEPIFGCGEVLEEYLTNVSFQPLWPTTCEVR